MHYYSEPRGKPRHEKGRRACPVAPNRPDSLQAKGLHTLLGICLVGTLSFAAIALLQRDGAILRGWHVVAIVVIVVLALVLYVALYLNRRLRLNAKDRQSGQELNVAIDPSLRNEQETATPRPVLNGPSRTTGENDHDDAT